MNLNSHDETHTFPESSVSHKDAQWTYFDYMRLVSLDELYHRSNDFNNDQSFLSSTILDGCMQELTKEPMHDEDAVIVERMDFNANCQQLSSEKYTAVNVNNLSQFGFPSAVTWFHIHDIGILRFIANKCKIRESFVAGFYDSRCQSNTLFSDDCAFISYCSVTFIESNAHLFKTYIIVTPSVYISFERELIPKRDCFVSIRRASLMDRLMENLNGDNLKKFVSEYGRLFFICEVGMEALSVSNCTIEYLSRCVFYVKVQIHNNLSYSEKLYYYRMILILQSIIVLLEKIMFQFSGTYQMLQAKTSFDIKAHCFIVSAMDSCNFRITCLQRLFYESSTVLSTMKNIQTVHNEKQTMNLSLIATILLPMTFLTGVFGMNFEKDGDYTIQLLNDPAGPIYFAAMCVCVVLINLYLFTKSGYINWRNDVFGDNNNMHEYASRILQKRLHRSK